MTAKQQTILRLSLLGGLMFGLVLLAKYTSLGQYFEAEALQELIKGAGKWGWLLFFLIFLIGTLMSAPGAIFLVFAILTYGYFVGIVLSYLAANVAAIINFWMARRVGGQSLGSLENKRIQKILTRVDEHPISTIVWLRLFMLLSPVVNYLLALTNIKLRHFCIGNALAMIFPFFLIVMGTILVRSNYIQESIGWGF